MDEVKNSACRMESQNGMNREVCEEKEKKNLRSNFNSETHAAPTNRKYVNQKTKIIGGDNPCRKQDMKTNSPENSKKFRPNF